MIEKQIPYNGSIWSNQLRGQKISCQSCILKKHSEKSIEINENQWKLAKISPNFIEFNVKLIKKQAKAVQLPMFCVKKNKFYHTLPTRVHMKKKIL